MSTAGLITVGLALGLSLGFAWGRWAARRGWTNGYLSGFRTAADFLERHGADDFAGHLRQTADRIESERR